MMRQDIGQLRPPTDIERSPAPIRPEGALPGYTLWIACFFSLAFFALLYLRIWRKKTREQPFDPQSECLRELFRLRSLAEPNGIAAWRDLDKAIRQFISLNWGIEAESLSATEIAFLLREVPNRLPMGDLLLLCEAKRYGRDASGAKLDKEWDRAKELIDTWALQSNSTTDLT